jgi:hypothetical protein
MALALTGGGASRPQAVNSAAKTRAATGKATECLSTMGVSFTDDSQGNQRNIETRDTHETCETRNKNNERRRRPQSH